MDALQISGKWYISSRRAAKEHGYHADYVGQLVRTGKVKGQKVGRSWYVLADSLTDYFEKEGGEPAPKISTKKKAQPEKIKKIPKPAPQSYVEEEEEEEKVETQEANVGRFETEERDTELPAPAISAAPPRESGTMAITSEREHPLLTYLHEEDPALPVVPPRPIVPKISGEIPGTEEGTRVPIHATVKRWGTAMQARMPAPAVHVLGTAPRRSKPSFRWLPLLVTGVAAFGLTLALSIGVSSSINAL